MSTPDDLLSDIVRRANRANDNGYVPMAEKPRPSGWVCPKCGEEADQRAEPVQSPIDGAPLGIRWLTLPDGTPWPINVECGEKVEKDGEPTVYVTRHCFNCFNKWQRQKMMEEVRANVPQLERKGR